jgi:hypothetical protein
MSTRRFIQVCAVDAQGAKRKEYRIGGSAEAIEAWARGLGPRDQVVLEATFHTWAIHALVSPYAGRVVVANPLQVKAIAHAKIKTEKVDTYTLACLLRAGFLPEVTLPDEATWALRQLVSQRRGGAWSRVRCSNAPAPEATVERRHARPGTNVASDHMEGGDLPMRMSCLARHLLLLSVAATASACGVGDDVVTGLGNGGNRFYATPVMDELAEQLAENGVVPPVTDEMLRSAFDAIASRAASGDPDAALILFRVAEEQRKAHSE